MTAPYPAEFYLQNAREVARQLIGAKLIRVKDGQRVAGMIVETEAYTGLDDLASHGKKKRTPRNLPMWEAPPQTFVYLTHGIHWMLNAVCEPADHPAAVLIRALEPLEGLDLMAARRGDKPPLLWTSGPARLTQALAVTGVDNRCDLTNPESGLWLEPYQTFADEQIKTGARIGLGKVPEPWLSMPWRWWLADHPHVSR